MATDKSLFPDDRESEQTPEQHERDRIREEYRARLAAKLKDPLFRKIEGFPIGTDEAILALSDPPYYTACPNPFIAEWLQQNAKPYNANTDDYHREPFATDVSEGKNDPIYNAHSYHTKVPHKAIMRYILHYTAPGDLVYDGFCGTGMTGVAVQMCGDKAQVESLGYRVQPDGTILDEEGKPFSKLGTRKALLNDLSPAATFIAYNYNTPIDTLAFEREAKRILKEVEAECGWMYSTLHDASPAETTRIAEAVSQCKTPDELFLFYKELQASRCVLRDPNSKLQVGRVNFTVLSDVLLCPSCGSEFVFWDVAVDEQAAKVLDSFQCPTCRLERTKRQCGHSVVTFYDEAIKQPVTQAKQAVVLLDYSVGASRYQRKPNSADLTLIEAITRLQIPNWFPSEAFMGKGEGWGDTYRAGYCAGVSHTHHFFTKRNMWVLASFFDKIGGSQRNALLSILTGGMLGLSKQQRYRPQATFPNMILSGTIYFGSMIREWNVFQWLSGKLGSSLKARLNGEQSCLISTQSCSSSNLSGDSVDYIFTDPPFGGNLQYSELNFSWEAWLRVKTNNSPEAVTSNSQHKGLAEYQELMTQCFAEYYRVLKSGRWMTVEFHNSANAVWNAIQEGLERVGFIVADVRVLDKQQQGFNAIVAASAVKQDLVISCYKPRHDFEERFRQVRGRPEGVVEFLRQHLAMLPVSPINKQGRLETVVERMRFLLFDRMIAYHLQRGARIPLSAVDFYGLLDEQFVERDEMYFLPDQAARYDAVKARGVETEQLSIFVRDEKTAVQWVRSRLTEQPQTLGELTPKFMQEMREWESHEPRPELCDLLREYFIENADVWRVPDPNNEKDLEALRRSALLKLFRDYVNAKGPLKVFRKEAVLEGFRHCWDTKQYGIITAICEKIPDKILQEIHEFVQFYDIAKDLAPQVSEQITFVWE